MLTPLSFRRNEMLKTSFYGKIKKSSFPRENMSKRTKKISLPKKRGWAWDTPLSERFEISIFFLTEKSAISSNPFHNSPWRKFWKLWNSISSLIKVSDADAQEHTVTIEMQGTREGFSVKTERINPGKDRLANFLAYER